MQTNLINILCISLMLLSLISAVAIIRSKTPIYSVLFLLVLFLCAALVLLLTSNEFLAFIYIIVYIGAVIVLLLWVIMTIPIKPFYAVPASLMVSFIVFSVVMSLTVIAIFIVSELPIIPVFKVSSTDVMFPVFFHVFAKYVGAEFYISFVNNVAIYSINGIDVYNMSNAHLSPKGQLLFAKLFAAVYVKAQLSQMYFPFSLSSDSILWKDLFAAYCVQHSNAHVPFFIKKLIFSYRLSDLILANLTTISYKVFVSNITSLNFIVLCSNFELTSSVPLHLFRDIAGMVTTSKIPFNSILAEKTFFDWVMIFSTFNSSLITNMAITLYVCYGWTLLSLSLLLLAAMIGVVLIVNPFESKISNTFFETNKHGNNKSNNS